ncbi:MAG: DUF1343 domain-containing protein [Dokdonia sp.]|jgi:uncharacterized protein YbbC (DUF1343 family)
MSSLLLKNTFFLTLILLISCRNAPENGTFVKTNSANDTELAMTANVSEPSIVVGANQTARYFPMLAGKKVGVVTNQSGLIFTSDTHDKQQSVHLVDSLQRANINVIRVFSPEHGFRGNVDAGEQVKDGKDTKTGLPIISLYGKNKKPTQQQLEGLDILVFDIQDVGVRFYTYISTLTYVMEAAAQKGIPVLVLDRPNPNAHYIDGPTLEPAHSSFLGMHPVPLVYGMTIGEYAKMVNGEQWLDDGLRCDLTVIPLKHWNYNSKYSLPTRPSPNLPNDAAINLYPSLGFFEGTTINAGRGTEMQFQIFGSSQLPYTQYPFAYTPKPNFGSKSPKENGVLCHGLDLRATPYLNKVDLNWLINAYAAHSDKSSFFKTESFTLHAGNTTLETQIKSGTSFEVIRESWQPQIAAFKQIRKKYLLYQ